MNYLEAAQIVSSEKITLATIESVERVKIFSPVGTDWARSSEFFVVGVKDHGVSISSWSFDPLTKVLTIIGGADPKTRNISLTYRHFFSTSPLNLPYDLSTGEAVEWLPLITQIGSVGQSLDEQSVGIVLETNSSVTMINQGFFDDIFDAHIFENQAIKIYSWFPSTPILEKAQLFEGVIESKDFSPATVSFKIKDFVYKLKNFVNLGLFANDQVLPSINGTPRRRIYGQVDNVKCVSISATLNGYTLSGTLSGDIATRAIIGVGTEFLKEVSPGDELNLLFNGELEKYSVEDVTDDFNLTLSKDLEANLVNATVTNSPNTPYRFMNRDWEIAGHKLRQPQLTITDVIAKNVFEVAEIFDLYSGDEILVNGIETTIRRVSGNRIITNSTINPSPIAGQFIVKRPVQKVFFKNKELFINRDFTVLNSTLGSVVIFNSLAEFNITEPRVFGINFTFTNGSRFVTTSSIVDLRTVIKPRDWVKVDLLNEPTYYEVLKVDEQGFSLRTAYTGTTGTKAAVYKPVEYINEESLITVNCLGIEYENKWVKTPSDCVRHLIKNDAGFAVVNEDRFEKARVDCDYIVSMVIPETIGSEAPLIRDTITKINESVFGSLYGDSSQNISFSILNATKPELSTIITDTDIISFSIQTNQKIINKIKVNYKPFVDVFNGEDSFKTIVLSSDFVNNLIGIESTEEKTIYLYEEDKARIIAQRMLLFNSLSNSSVKIRSKLNLAKTLVNDKIYLSLDRLYKRYAGRDKRKLAIVTSVKIDGYNTDLTLTDLGNIFNRVPSIAPNTTPSYSTASDDDKLKWGFIVSNDTETPDESSEITLGGNIFG